MNGYPSRRRADVLGDAPQELLRALVVDDEADYRAYIGAVTRRCGYVVDHATDGAQALEKLTQTSFDLLIVDQEMPRLRGLEVIGAIRASDWARGAYAIMLTANQNVQTKLAALHGGFDDFMTKASSEEEIVAKLAAARRIILRQRRLDVEVRELYGMATRDELTGVFNRRVFVVETEKLIEQRVPINVVLFDLDDFKQVNDTFGHVVGDRVLRDVGTVFLRHTRAEDLVARYGGDEFVLVVVNLPIDEAVRVADRLVAEIARLEWVSNRDPFRIGVTVGLASSRMLLDASLEQLLNAADRDLYTNKWLRSHPRSPGITPADLRG